MTEIKDKQMKELLGLILPLTPFYEMVIDPTKFSFIAREDLDDCVTLSEGFVYDADIGALVLTDDIVKTAINTEITLNDSNSFNLPTKATGENITVFKNGKILLKEAGKATPNWVFSGTQIITLGEPIQSTDSFQVIYEQLKTIVTPSINSGISTNDSDLVVDAYIYIRASVIEEIVSTTEDVIFDIDGNAILTYISSDTNIGELTLKNDNITQWYYTANNAIKIDSNFYEPGIYKFKYNTKHTQAPIPIVTIWHSYSANNSIWSDWEEIELKQRIYPAQYHKFKIQFQGNLKSTDVRVRSFCTQWIQTY